MISRIKKSWTTFEARKPGLAQFVMFAVLSNGMTVLQLALMPIFRWIFGFTALADTDFQIFPVGLDESGKANYIFDYSSGELPQGGGGLAYFLAVQVTLAIAQVINFFAQRNITFKSNSNPWVAAGWYFAAYVVITFLAAAAQGLYRAPIYGFFIDTLGWGGVGETSADVVTMIINSAISFWVFYPIFKVIFRREPQRSSPNGAAPSHDSEKAEQRSA